MELVRAADVKPSIPPGDILSESMGGIIAVRLGASSEFAGASRMETLSLNERVAGPG